MKVAYIHGINEIPRKVTSPTRIDVSAWTPAELYLILVKRRHEILKDYYGDPSGSLQKSITRVENAISGGVSSFTFNGFQDPGLDTVNEAIQYAKTLDNTKPYHILIPNEQRFQNFGQSIITSSSITLPEIDRQKWIENYFIKNGYAEIVGGKFKFKSSIPKPPSKIFDSIVRGGDAAWESFQKFRYGLNQSFEGVGHHVLYEFISPTENVPAAVTTKSILHKQALDIISKAVIVPREALTIWTENGVMRYNALNGTEPYSAAETIQILKTTQNKINAVPAVVAVIAAIAGAITAAATLINAIKSTPEGDYMNQVQGFSTPTYGPQQNDFFQSNNLSSNNILPLILIGGGALYFLTSK